MRSPRSPVPFRWVGSIAGVAVWLSGCAGTHFDRPREVSHPQRERPSAEVLRERAARAIAQAVFYKPTEASLGGPEGALAPLVVQGVAGGAAPEVGFGAIVGDVGEERIDAERPTVYVLRGWTRVGGADLEQWTYYWRYAASCGSTRCVSCSGRGVRVTLGADDLPIVWEALSTDDDRRILFVSRALEEAAVREFGDPLPDRTFSIERAIEEAKNVVVVRLLDDASVAMGPYVYLDAAPNGDVTTVLCRCMPSQVDEFVETRSYNLVSTSPLPLLGCGLTARYRPKPRIRWSCTMSVYELQMWPSSVRSFEMILRWPREVR